jgi:hypothetical protein
MTAIRRVVRKQYYHKYQHLGKSAYKGRYERVRYRLEFPFDLDVSDLVDKELEFERVGDEVRLRPKKKV